MVFDACLALLSNLAGNRYNSITGLHFVLIVFLAIVMDRQ